MIAYSSQLERGIKQMSGNEANEEFREESPAVHWKDALRLERTSFVMGVKIHKAMRTKEGFVREFTRKLRGVDETLSILFDETYTFDKFLRDVAEPLGYVQNGQLHPDFINGYLKRFQAWLATAGIEEQRDAIWKEANNLSAKYGKPADYFFKVLGGEDLGKEIESSVEVEDTPSVTNGKNAKQTARIK